MDKYAFILGCLGLLIGYVGYCNWLGHDGVLINTVVGIFAAVITWVTKGVIEEKKRKITP